MSILSSLMRTRLIDIKFSHYRFNPGIFITLVTILVAYILFSLGQWQISRAEYKENLQQKIVQRQNLPVTTIQKLPDSMDERLYLPLMVDGHFDEKKQFLLDNRVVNEKVGYDVYTPFLTNDGHALLINRGFVAMGQSREQLPNITVSNQAMTLTGLLNKAPSRGLILGENLNSDASWPVVLQYIDMKELSNMLNYQLMDMVLRLNKDENGALIYDLPVLNLNAAKNHGYAFQWFAMCLTVCLLYLFLNTKKQMPNIEVATNNTMNGK